MTSKKHWFEKKTMSLVSSFGWLKKIAGYTKGSGNQNSDNDILITMDDYAIQIEVKWRENKAGNMIISKADWDKLEEQAAPFNYPVMIKGNSKLELAAMKPPDLLNILDDLQRKAQYIKELESKVEGLEHELEDYDKE